MEPLMPSFLVMLAFVLTITLAMGLLEVHRASRMAASITSRMRRS
ncbi:MAG: hypothetical protein P0111_00995 [Nitrospira sp.]|nr:hypothetical protein [Nitrospira sp.]